MNKKSNFPVVKISIAIGVVLALAAIYFVFIRGAGFSNGFHAVFLDNNQVYFGRIQDKAGKYLIIFDVYYFGKDNSQLNNNDLVLIKLGSETHGPTNQMQILENHILYIEELSNTSQVVRAIDEHKEK